MLGHSRLGAGIDDEFVPRYLDFVNRAAGGLAPNGTDF